MVTPYDLDDEAQGLRDYIKSVSMQYMPEPVRITINQGETQDQTGYVFGLLSGRQVRVLVPSHWDLKTTGVESAFIVLALPPNGPTGDYVALWPIWDGLTASRIPQLVTRVKVATNNTATPPTDGELDTAFGTKAKATSGLVFLLDDNDADTNVYLVAANGTSWWYVALTKAT